jgi:streptogramin lyase
MSDLGRTWRRSRTWLLAALSAAICSLLPVGDALSSEEPTIFEMAPAMHARGVTIGPDGNLWFAATRSSGSRLPGAVGRVEPDGRVVEYGLQESSGASKIVSGPDGNLWFIEPDAGRIGRVTVGGEITTFPLPDSASRPVGIAAGADGSLWFSEYAASRIGRITTAGAITEFALDRGSKPAGIVAGPDGNLWFTERGANRIGRITPAGRIAEFPLAGADPRPIAIAAGPDGNLWFSSEGANRIGRITPAGAISEFPVPILNGATAIAAGPDGNLWFSSYGQVGAIATDGRLTRLTCLKTNCNLPVLSLAAGAGGEMWAGTSTEYTGGGGGTYIITNLTQPGYLARFTPRSSSTELTSGPRPVKRRRTRLELSCGSSSGCHGNLRLSRQRAVFPGEPGVNYSVVPIGSGRYDLNAGERRSVLVKLNRRGAKLLAKRPLSAWALAETGRGDLETARLVALRRAIPQR